MDSYKYSEETLAHSRKLYKLLRNRLREDPVRTITYGQAGNLLGIHPRAMKFPLAKVQDECRETIRPTLTVLVVSDQNGRPSTGCDAQGNVGFRKTMDAIKAIEWPAEPWW